MKIALLLTGFIRQHSNCKESVLEHIIKKYDTDVYFATWNKTQSYLNSSLIPVNYQELIDSYTNTNGFLVLDYDNYMENKIPIKFQKRKNDVFLINQRAKEHGKFWIERLRDQWYVIQQGFLIIPNRYDIIIRLRLDVKLHNFNIKSNLFTIPKPHPNNPYNDHIAYGTVEQMKKYCSLYDNIEKMYIEDNVDISFAELMLKHYMENRNPIIKTNIDDTISYEILK
jgi:hypothetical protein